MRNGGATNDVAGTQVSRLGVFFDARLRFRCAFNLSMPSIRTAREVERRGARAVNTMRCVVLFVVKQ